MSNNNGRKFFLARVIVILTLFGCLSIATLRYNSTEVQKIPPTSRSLKILSRKHEGMNTQNFFIPNMVDNHLSADQAIITPADMWKNPKRDPSWHPVDLPNCCYGRQKRGRRRLASTLTSQWLTKCKNKVKIYRYVGPGEGLTNNDLKTALRNYKGDLFILGDSLSRQWFEQLACYLGGWKTWKGFAKVPVEVNRLSFENDITEALIKFRPKWGERGHLGTNYGKISRFGHFDIPTDTNDMVDQRVIYHAIHQFTKEEMMDLLLFYDSVYPREFARERPVFIINKGLHYNKFRLEGQGSPADLYDHLKSLFKICQDFGMRCIFPETSPQHFDNPDGNGLYTGPSNRVCMKYPPNSFDTLDRWRVDLLHRVAEESLSNRDQEGDGFVRVMPLFDKLVYLSSAHNGSPPAQDCTHFSSDPQFWEPWHVSLTQILQELQAMNMKTT